MRTLEKGSVVGTRKGRRFAIAGISAVALLAPMVTAVPAMAAPNNSVSITVNDWNATDSVAGTDAFPAQTVIGAASKGAITVKNLTAGAGPISVESGNTFKVEAQLKGAGIVAATAGGTFDAELDLKSAHISRTSGSIDFQTTSVPTGMTYSTDALTIQDDIDNTASAGLKDKLDAGGATLIDGEQLDLTVNGGWTGDLTANVSVIEINSSDKTSARWGARALPPMLLPRRTRQWPLTRARQPSRWVTTTRSTPSS